MLDPDFSQQSNNTAEDNEEKDESLTDQEIAILFMIVMVFVCVIVVLPIVLSVSPTYK